MWNKEIKMQKQRQNILHVGHEFQLSGGMNAKCLQINLSWSNLFRILELLKYLSLVAHC